MELNDSTRRQSFNGLTAMAVDRSASTQIADFIQRNLRSLENLSAHYGWNAPLFLARCGSTKIVDLI